MANFIEVVENGNVFYISDELGNIMKVSDNMFVGMIPKVVKVGPFSTLEEAKKCLEDKASLDMALEQYNHNLLEKK